MKSLWIAAAALFAGSAMACPADGAKDAMAPANSTPVADAKVFTGLKQNLVPVTAPVAQVAALPADQEALKKKTAKPVAKSPADVR